MYVVTSRPFVRRTRATLRRAEFGFFGVVVYTRVHTPRFCGHAFKCGDLLFSTSWVRPLRTSWLIVGIVLVPRPLRLTAQQRSRPRTGGSPVSLPAHPSSRWVARVPRPARSAQLRKRA